MMPPNSASALLNSTTCLCWSRWSGRWTCRRVLAAGVVVPAERKIEVGTMGMLTAAAAGSVVLLFLLVFLLLLLLLLARREFTFFFRGGRGGRPLGAQ